MDELNNFMLDLDEQYQKRLLELTHNLAKESKTALSRLTKLWIGDFVSETCKAVYYQYPLDFIVKTFTNYLKYPEAIVKSDVITYLKKIVEALEK